MQHENEQSDIRSNGDISLFYQSNSSNRRGALHINFPRRRLGGLLLESCTLAVYRNQGHAGGYGWKLASQHSRINPPVIGH